MLARPVQRRERFERGSGRRALHGPDRWRQWRCAAITSGSGERMDRAKSNRVRAQVGKGCLEEKAAREKKLQLERLGDGGGADK